MVNSEKHQKALLGGIERFFGFAHPDKIAEVSKVLMEFYQIDILDEEIVIQWGTHVSKKYVDKDTSKKVRKASEPFLKVSIFSNMFVLSATLILFSGSRRPTMTMRKTMSKSMG
jgi:hypothetical protein